MAGCTEINLMLGAFEDGELEPHEMQDVAHHLARCEACTGMLEELSSIGRELRSMITMPPLENFASSVLERIERLPVPIGLRVRRFLGRVGDEINAGLGMGAAVAVAAMLTALLVTPYARQMIAREFGGAARSRESQRAATAPQPAEPIPQEVAELASDSHVVISRLEAEMPSVAVWSEPQTDTTVIWLPDQQ